MLRYLMKPKNRVCLNHYGYFSLAKNMRKNFAKTRKKILLLKYKAKQSANKELKTTLKRSILKTILSGTGNYIGKNIVHDN